MKCSRNLISTLAVLSLIAFADMRISFAGDKEGAAQKSAVVSSEQIEQAVKNLGSDQFDARNEATKLLVEAGVECIEPVVNAADTDDLELAARCIDILKKLSSSSDEATNKAAERSLQSLRKSNRRSVARRAAAALKKEEPKAAANVVANGIQIQVQVVAGPGGKRVQIARQNKNQQITVEENGQKIQINETAGKGIQITLTETIDGKKKTTEYKAKDLAELKKKHPKAAEIYEKHVPQKQNGVAGIFGNGRIQIQAAPGIRIAQPRIVANKAALEDLHQATKEVQRIAEALHETVSAESPNVKEIQGLVKQLDEATNKLEKARAALSRP